VRPDHTNTRDGNGFGGRRVRVTELSSRLLRLDLRRSPPAECEIDVSLLGVGIPSLAHLGTLTYVG
jgi:hypothetical protein